MTQRDGRSVGVSFLFRSLLAKAKRLARDNAANTAMMFGLSVVPILVATGAGLDFARGVMVHQRMMEALDASALAVGNATSKPSGCSSDGTSSATTGNGSSSSPTPCASVQKIAQQYFDQNYDHTKDATYGAPGPVKITITGQSVTLTDSLPLQLTLLGISSLNVGSPTVNASSTVVWGQTKLWVALVLDNSGSMDKGDSGGSKMDALHDALTNSTYGLLGILHAASANAGDVEVGIVPFTRSVNMGYSAFATSPYIDWGEWEAPPANPGTLGNNLGPGDDCPWSTNSEGYRCLASSSNSASSTSSIPSSGLICPGIDNGRVNADHNDRYYNGCYTSVGSNNTTNGTVTNNTFCSNNSNCTVANKCGGYPQTGTSTSGHATTTTTTTCSCSGTGNSKSCKTTATPVTVTTTYTHAWQVNAHSTWSGCVMDRQRLNKQTTINGGTGLRVAANTDYDETNTQPNSSTTTWDDTQFPAENGISCPDATVTTLGYNWTTLASQVTAMDANGSTNQAIGVEHGFQMLTTGAPYGTGTLPGGTTKVIILFSDGLNTEDRWYGDGATEGTTQDGYIDTRENASCTAAKAANITIYAIFIHIGTNGSSTALSNCATDSTKYYDLTASSQIKTAFSDIAQKITNLRVSQ